MVEMSGAVPDIFLQIRTLFENSELQLEDWSFIAILIDYDEPDFQSAVSNAHIDHWVVKPVFKTGI